MRSTLSFALALTLIAAAVGCGQSETPQATTPPPAGTAASAKSTAPSDPICRVAYDFLEAIRLGDGPAANNLLTPLAQEMTKRQDLIFAPPSTPTARFEVFKAEKVEDEALVRAVWSDVDVDGKPYSEDILCALRLIEGQWRVYGMAQYMGVDQPPVPLNFEEPPAEQKPVDPKLIAAPGATPPGGQPASEIARNPFDQASQR